MELGIARYFSSVDPCSVVHAKATLLKAAEQFEAFLEGPGRNSDLAALFDDLDVAGLRSAAGWVSPEARLIGTDFYELFGIATSANYAPLPDQSDSKVYEAFQQKVQAFMEEHTVRTS
jgi:hypothetical protein